MKKVFLLFLMIISTMLCVKSTNVHALSYASIYDFTYDTDAYTNVGWNSNKITYHEFGENIVGAATLNVAYYKLNDEYVEEPGYDIYVILFRVTMTPYLIYGDQSDWHGWSDDVQVYSDLDYYASGEDNILVYYSPTAQASKTTYNVGLGLNYSPTGFGGGITASTTFVNKDLDIINQSNSPELHFGVNYKYNEDLNPLAVLRSPNYFVTESYQYGMYIVKNPKSDNFFSNRIFITSNFEANAGITKWKQVFPECNSQETDSYYFSHVK